MSYNSALDELFLVDCINHVVRVIRLRDNAGDLQDVYRGSHDTPAEVLSVCHMRDSDTLFVCSSEIGPDENKVNWLVALNRNGNEWRESQLVQTDGNGHVICQLSDSRILIGESYSSLMEIFSVQNSRPQIARVQSIHLPEKYFWFSAKCVNDTLVAMTYFDTDLSVRLHRLLDDRLEELAHILINNPVDLLWLSDRLVVSDLDDNMGSHAIIELEVTGTGLERRRELISSSENINENSWSLADDGIVMFDDNSKDIFHYSIA